jgi:hypothetical protein
VQRRLLSGDKRCNHVQEARKLMSIGQGTQALGASDKDRCKIGKANGVALGDVTQRVFTKGRRRGTRRLTQDFFTS